MRIGCLSACTGLIRESDFCGHDNEAAAPLPDTGRVMEVFAEKVGIRVRYTKSIEAGEYWPMLPTPSALVVNRHPA